MEIWNKLESVKDQIHSIFLKNGYLEQSLTENNDWQNFIYNSETYRRAHLEIVDKRTTHKIFIIHCTIFPFINDTSPLLGFDIIAGQNKISGAFLDFSPLGDTNHYMMEYFNSLVNEYNWKKVRELPEWAKEIFSKNIVAAGQLKDVGEIDRLCELMLRAMEYYLNNIGKTLTNQNFTKLQNKYCIMQKKNPQIANSLIAMGYESSKVKQFIDEILFPEI